MMTYNLSQIHNIASSGFKYEMSIETFNRINSLCEQIGVVGIASPVFQAVQSIQAKLPLVQSSLNNSHNNNYNTNNHNNSHNNYNNNKKRRGNRNMEITDAKCLTLTKIETKRGMDGDIDQIRLSFNKLTDKTFTEMRENIIEKITKICSESTHEEDITKIGNIVYDMCSSNKFYSKIFVELFIELAAKFDWLMLLFNDKHSKIMTLYDDILYVDSEKNYDGFCEMNKKNELRKSATTFMLNLANQRFLLDENIAKLLRNLLVLVHRFIDEPDRKNEVDELTENVAILFIGTNKTCVACITCADYLIDEKTIVETVEFLSKTKSKNHLSLSSRAIFKYMDLFELYNKK